MDPTLVISIVVALIFQQDSKAGILKLVVLVKLAFAMQRLKKHLKKILTRSTKIFYKFLDFVGGVTNVMRGT